MAIASGITLENSVGHVDVADRPLVATGISRSFTELEPGKLRRPIERVRDCGGAVQ